MRTCTPSPHLASRRGRRKDRTRKMDCCLSIWGSSVLVRCFYWKSLNIRSIWGSSHCSGHINKSLVLTCTALLTFLYIIHDEPRNIRVCVQSMHYSDTFVCVGRRVLGTASQHLDGKVRKAGICVSSHVHVLPRRQRQRQRATP